MKQRRWLVAGTLVAVLAAGVAAGVLSYRNARGQTTWVAKVNGQPITTNAWNRYRTAVAGAGAPASAASLDSLIDERLQLQEAARRGFTCTDAATLAWIQQHDAMNRSAGYGGLYGLLLEAYDAGYATRDMFAGLATAQALPPPAETAIARYESAPSTLAVSRDECTLNELGSAIASGAAAGAGAPDVRATVIARLRAQATIEIAITVPTPSATPRGGLPTATPSPAPTATPTP